MSMTAPPPVPSPASPMTWLAHAHPLMSEGLAVALARHGEVRRLAPGSGLAGLGWAGASLLVTDRHTALTATAQPSACPPVLVVDFGLCGQSVRRLLDAGVRGCVHADSELDEVARAVEQLRCGARHLCPLSAAALAEEVVPASFTAREEEVLDLVCQGLDNKRIALHLGLALSTVKSHVQSLLSKTGARSRTDLVAAILRRGVR